MYAPLCTDIVNLLEFYDTKNVDEEGFGRFEFDMGEPFPSLAQLLSVLPPQSAKLLPKPLGELMIQPTSPLIPFYPNDFESDPNGKRQSWEAIVQIPFIEAGILLDTVKRVLKEDDKQKEKMKDEGEDGSANTALLTPGERRRNTPGKEHVFVAPGLSEEEEAAYAATRAAMLQSLRGQMPSRSSGGRGEGRGRGGRGGGGRGRGRGGRGRGRGGRAVYSGRGGGRQQIAY